MLAPRALTTHAEQVGYESDKIYFGKCRQIDTDGEAWGLYMPGVQSVEDLVDLPNMWRGTPRGHIIQMETLFPLDLYKAFGGLDEEAKYTMDFKLWGGLLLAGAEIQYTHIEVGMFRNREEQKTSDQWETTKSLVRNAVRFDRDHPTWSARKKNQFVRRLEQYRNEFWRGTSRLERADLSESLFLWLRDVRRHLSA